MSIGDIPPLQPDAPPPEEGTRITAVSTPTIPTKSTLPPIPTTSIEFIGSVNETVSVNEQRIGQLKQSLDTMRNEIRDNPELENISTFQPLINERYLGILESVFCIALERMGDCPIGDQWAILGIGSLGRGEISPYSDLDFALIVKEDSDEVKEFFKGVMTHVNAIINHMGDEDGFVLCEGGLNPPYLNESNLLKGSKELIGTPTTLSQYVLKKAQSQPILMAAYSLLQSDRIHGDKEIFQEFRDQVINEENKNFLGSSFLKQGLDFWKNKSEIHNLEITDPKLDWRTNTTSISKK